jgi:hypothetical protein
VKLLWRAEGKRDMATAAVSHPLKPYRQKARPRGVDYKGRSSDRFELGSPRTTLCASILFGAPANPIAARPPRSPARPRLRRAAGKKRESGDESGDESGGESGAEPAVLSSPSSLTPDVA